MPWQIPLRIIEPRFLPRIGPPQGIPPVRTRGLRHALVADSCAILAREGAHWAVGISIGAGLQRHLGSTWRKTAMDASNGVAGG